MYYLTYFDVCFYFLLLLLFIYFNLIYIIFIFYFLFFEIVLLIFILICVLYHSYLSFFSLPLVCDALLSHLLLSKVTAYIHGIVNAFLSSPAIAYMFTVLLLYLIYAMKKIAWSY